jgi:hypothetical protein
MKNSRRTTCALFLSLCIMGCINTRFNDRILKYDTTRVFFEDFNHWKLEGIGSPISPSQASRYVELMFVNDSLMEVKGYNKGQNVYQEKLKFEKGIPYAENFIIQHAHQDRTYYLGDSIMYYSYTYGKYPFPKKPKDFSPEFFRLYRIQVNRPDGLVIDYLFDGTWNFFPPLDFRFCDSSKLQ